MYPMLPQRTGAIPSDYSQPIALLGTPAAQPAAGRVQCIAEYDGDFFRLTFILDKARIPVTDATTSGSSGSLKLFDFTEGALVPLGSRQNYTAFAEGAALTTADGDAAFVMGVGSAAANAGDGALTGTEVDFAPVTGTITLSDGNGSGTKIGGPGAAIDGTGTAADMYLNWSGTAATIDANSTIDVTGTVEIFGLRMGDD